MDCAGADRGAGRLLAPAEPRRNFIRRAAHAGGRRNERAYAASLWQIATELRTQSGAGRSVRPISLARRRPVAPARSSEGCLESSRRKADFDPLAQLPRCQSRAANRGRGGTPRQEQLSHRRRSERVANEHSDLRQSPVPRGLAGRGRRLLRQSATTRIRFRDCAGRQSARDPTPVRRREEGQSGQKRRPRSAAERARAAATAAGGLPSTATSICKRARAKR